MDNPDKKDNGNGEQRFNVVVTGELLDGYQIDDAKRSVAAMFQVDVSAVEGLFGAGERVVKRDLPRDKAERIVSSFTRSGLNSRLEAIKLNNGAQTPESLEIERKKPHAAERSSVVSREITREGAEQKQGSIRTTTSGIIGGVLAGFLFGYLVFGPWRVPLLGLTAAEEKQVTAMDIEIKDTSGEIAKAEVERAALSGGLVAVLIDARLEILRTTQALLEQRVRGMRAGMTLRQEAPGTHPDQERAKELSEKIKAQQAAVELARAESGGSGGLVGALSHARLATEEQTLAMLRLAEVSARYGLPQIAAPASAPPVEQGVRLAASAAKTDNKPALPVHDGPLGLTMGLRVEELDATPVPNSPGKYILARVPRPHPNFQIYAAKVSPTAGLCWLRAVGHDIQTDSYGLALRSQYHDLRDRVAEVYGRGFSETDFVLPGSVWTEDKYWMMALRQKERVLMSSWNLTGNPRRSDGLSNVLIAASVNDSGDGYIAVEYNFNNSAACDAEINGASDKAL